MFPSMEIKFPFRERHKWHRIKIGWTNAGTKVRMSPKICTRSKIQMRPENPYKTMQMGQMKNHNFSAIEKRFRREKTEPYTSCFL